MNSKVMRTVLALMWGFLLSFMVVKLFFATQFVACVENEKILMIGAFIDENLVVRICVDTLISILTLHFYLCSCRQSWHLSWVIYGCVIVYCFILNLCYLYNPTIAMSVDLLGLLIFPIALKADVKQIISVFILHYAGQAALLFIRSEPLYLASTNYATQFLLIFDVYIWLLIYYLYSNFYKEETLWERLAYPFSVITRKLRLRRKS